MRARVRTLSIHPLLRLRPACLGLALLACSSLLGTVGSAAAATLDVTGLVTASGLNFGTVMAYQPFTIYPFSNLDNGTGSATAVSGFASLAGVAPADLTIRFGDLERTGPTWPGGCTPTPAANCPSVSNAWGNTDAGTPYFEIDLAGTGTILSGTLQWTTTTNTTFPSATFGQGSGVGTVVFGSGLAPYLDDVFALTGGTGVAQIGSNRFNAVCSGGDPCNFSLDATLTFVPEPTSALLIGAGLALLACARSTSGVGWTPR
jgi:hypothetical protein